jgi:uncharacterized protein YkwD
MTRRALLHLGGVATSLVAGQQPVAEREEDTFARRIFLRTNELRVASGFEPLLWSAALARCAKEQSERKDQLRFPAHDDPERGPVATRITAAGIPWDRCGENLFTLRGWDDPVHFSIVFWWYSPGHQANMLNPEFTHTGVGVVQGQDETFFVTQIFLRPPQQVKRAR